MLKKSFNFVAVILAAVTVIGLSSCKDEVRYSCDPTIDAVIKQKLPYYENMTREKWKNLPDSLKDAAFVAMKPEVKKEFWYGKLSEIKEAKFFNDSEKEHISKLYEYFLSIDYLYTDKYKDDSPEMQGLFDYYKEWAFYGVDFLDWDVVDIFLIAEDKEELDEDYIEHVKQNTRPPSNFEYEDGFGPNGGKPNCRCKYDLGCSGQENECNTKADCVGVPNCGPLSSSQCTGLCTKGVTQLQYNSQRELLEYMFIIK
jgi:hypothetical protein